MIKHKKQITTLTAKKVLRGRNANEIQEREKKCLNMSHSASCHSEVQHVRYSFESQVKTHTEKTSKNSYLQ